MNPVDVFGPVPLVRPATVTACGLHSDCLIASAVMVTGCASVQHLSAQH